MATAERGAGTGIFRRKPIGAPEEVPERAGVDRGLARSLGLWQLTAIGIGFSIWLITFLDPVTWLRFAAWFVLGVLVYAFYSYRRSALAPRD
jgi:hypothetical protein